MSDTTDLRDLDIQIAKALGYRFEREPYMNAENTLIFYPDGRQAYTKTFRMEQRPSAVFAPNQIYDAISNWSGDLNAAASLPIDEGYRLVVTVSHDQKAIATFQYWSVLSEIWFSDIERAADTEAEARALAWLARHEGKLQAAKTNAGSQST